MRHARLLGSSALFPGISGWVVEALDDRTLYPGMDGLNRKDSLPCIATFDSPDEIDQVMALMFGFPGIRLKIRRDLKTGDFNLLG